jgi:hypothetical protein
MEAIRYRVFQQVDAGVLEKVDVELRENHNIARDP